MTDKWIEDIREKMSTCEVDEPAGLHDMIFARQASSTPVRSRFRIMILSGAVAASVIILLSLACFWRIIEPGANDIPVLMAQKEISVKTISAEVSDRPLHVAQVEKRLNSSARPKPVASVAAPQPEQTDNSAAHDNLSSKQPEKNSSGTASSLSKQTHEDEPVQNDATDLIISRKRKSGLSVGAFTSGAFGSADRQSSAVSPCASTYRWLESSDFGDVLSPLVRSRAANDIDMREIDMHHNLPLRFGLSVRYDFNSRFGIESGLVYSRLSSDLSGGARQNIKGQQVLHYMGVPLNIKYRIASWRSFSLYASAGVMMEKCVDGSLTKEELSNTSSDIKTSSIGISEDALQWSSNIAADLQFDITRHIGVYIEPGISYYFDNRSEVRNIYKDRPFNFNLNLGLRYTFGSTR